MSEVNRYHVVSGRLCEGVPLGMIGVVLVADFDRVTAERDAALADLKRHQSLFNQSERALDRVHCMYMKRLLDLTGEPQVALVPDEEFVKYFEELKTLKRENSGLQQRLTAADERADVLEGLVRDAQKAFNYDPAGSCYNPGIQFVKPWSERAIAALKPADPGEPGGAQ